MARPNIVLIAHNIRSLWNIGSFFRTGDALNVEKIFLTGYSGTPPRVEIGKTALKADEWVPWEYEKDPLRVINRLRKEGYAVVALEKTNTSENIAAFDPPGKICLIAGHEVLGVSAELLAVSDHVVHIPMYGKKESLNVAVAFGIALYALNQAQKSVVSR